MKDNEIIKALERCPQHTECCYCNSLDECGNKRILTTSALDLINRLINNAKKDNRIIELQDKKIAEQKTTIENFNYSLKCTKDHIEKLAGQSKCQRVKIDELEKEIEEINEIDRESELQALKENEEHSKLFCEAINYAKSEARKELAEQLKKEFSVFDMSSVGLPDYDRGYKDCITAVEDTLDSLIN